MCLSCYTITAVWLVCSEMLCNLFTFFQVNWDKELLYRDFSLISCHLYFRFRLPFWIEALNGLWMIQEGIVCSWIDLYRYTACSLTCERSKLSRGWYYLLLMTVGAHDYCRFMNIENFAESVINYSNLRFEIHEAHDLRNTCYQDWRLQRLAMQYSSSIPVYI